MYNKWVFSILTLFALASCKKEVQPGMAPLNQGCDCAKEVSAEFTMEEMSGQGQSWTKYTVTDTIWDGKNVRFTALEENAEYTWYLGAEIIHEKSFMRYFKDLKGQSIPVRLEVKKKPNYICFPKDDGFDLIAKRLEVSDKVNYSDTSYLLEGTFRLKEKNSTDSIDVKVDFVSDMFSQLVINLYNYDGKESNSIGYYGGYWINYRQVWFNIGEHQVMLYHNLSGEITLNIIGDDAKYQSFYYSGRKL